MYLVDFSDIFDTDPPWLVDHVLLCGPESTLNTFICGLVFGSDSTLIVDSSGNISVVLVNSEQGAVLVLVCGPESTLNIGSSIVTAWS